jgi:hypothetical protein
MSLRYCHCNFAEAILYSLQVIVFDKAIMSEENTQLGTTPVYPNP